MITDDRAPGGSADRVRGRNEAGTARALREHRAAADPLIAEHGGRIVKTTCAKPGDIPIYLPTKYGFVINLRAAKALGLTVPPMLLATADEVIE
jgi:hypothetical protein